MWMIFRCRKAPSDRPSIDESMSAGCGFIDGKDNGESGEKRRRVGFRRAEMQPDTVRCGRLSSNLHGLNALGHQYIWV